MYGPCSPPRMQSWQIKVFFGIPQYKWNNPGGDDCILVVVPMDYFNRKSIFQSLIFMGHVSFPVSKLSGKRRKKKQGELQFFLNQIPNSSANF